MASFPPPTVFGTAPTIELEVHDVPVVWDPVIDIDLKNYLVFRAAELFISNVNQGLKIFTIQGMYASWFAAGELLYVTGSNSGTYTVVSSTQPSGMFTTEIKVAEAIPSSTIDGTIGQALLQDLAYRGTSSGFTDKDLPRGFFYYVIYAVDKRNNFSLPSDIVFKSSPSDLVAPAVPSNVQAYRTADLSAVELTWNENTEKDFAGYAIFRTVDGFLYELIGTTSSNKFKDSAIPLALNDSTNTTFVNYTIVAYDKNQNVSNGSTPTEMLEIPLITKLRGIVDYLSINVYWENPLPEHMPHPDHNKFDVYYRELGTTTWIVVGTVNYPQSFARIDGPLIKNRTYEIGVNVKPYSGPTVFIQPEPAIVVIPNYTEDITPPNAPVLELAEVDPQNDRILLSWMRRIVDDDLLYYDVKWSSKWNIANVLIGTDEFVIAGDFREFFDPNDIILIEGTTVLNGEYTVKAVSYSGGNTLVKTAEDLVSVTTIGTIKNFITYKTTKDNEVVFRNPRRSRTYGAPNYEMYFRVDAIDRADNRTKGQEEEVKLVSTDFAPPQWYDGVTSVPTSYVAPGKAFDIMWDDSAQEMKYFRRYLIYESIVLIGSGTYPVFNFTDHELRGTSFDNYLRIYSSSSIRGNDGIAHPSTIGKKWIVVAVEDWFGDVRVYDPGVPPNYIWLELPA